MAISSTRPDLNRYLFPNMDCWLLCVPINRRNDFLFHPTHSATFRRFWYRPWGNLVQREGLEPTTRRVWVFSSNRLSYLCIAMVAEVGIRTHISLLMRQHQSQSWFTPHIEIKIICQLSKNCPLILFRLANSEYYIIFSGSMQVPNFGLLTLFYARSNHFSPSWIRTTDSRINSAVFYRWTNGELKTEYILCMLPLHWQPIKWWTRAELNRHLFNAIEAFCRWTIGPMKVPIGIEPMTKGLCYHPRSSIEL